MVDEGSFLQPLVEGSRLWWVACGRLGGAACWGL